MLGAVVLAAAALATAFGADDARRPFNAARLAEDSFARSLAGGDPAIAGEALATLRARLATNPLDAASRTVAASLMTEIAADASERGAAADQAATATRLVRSDEFVARAAARVLARAGRSDEALREIAAIFAYAPGMAALALSEIEPFVAPDELERGIPAQPEAWLAWTWKLRELGRDEEADARLASALDRWPEDLSVRQAAASLAAGREQIPELVRLVPPSMVLPATAEAATLIAYRARSKAASGDRDGAVGDAAQAVALRPGDPWVMVAAGDALSTVDAVAARGYWNRALYDLEARAVDDGTTVWIHFRLARLDDREGHGANALRHWRSILAMRPGNAEAKRRIDELTGGSPP
jgi:tetratricopeptide (TPR) repeat protein